MIKILCDSITDLPIEIIKKHNIDIVPLTVIFNEKEYLDRVDITTNEFYKMLRENDTMPKTSQATYAQFVKFFEKYKDDLNLLARNRYYCNMRKRKKVQRCEDVACV